MEARKQIWGNFINHAGREKFSVSENGLENLSEFNLNGREIKNLIKSGAKVSTEQLRVLDETRVKIGSFDTYFPKHRLKLSQYGLKFYSSVSLRSELCLG